MVLSKEISAKEVNEGASKMSDSSSSGSLDVWF